ncbi:hypothetical protein HDV05_005365 [Chytridiales sp. JEL 0842]|nr:hypothetical protein HDV05_005365 [Chytridiales sp. JEL 0842]
MDQELGISEIGAGQCDPERFMADVESLCLGVETDLQRTIAVPAEFDMKYFMKKNKYELPTDFAQSNTSSKAKGHPLKVNEDGTLLFESPTNPGEMHFRFKGITRTLNAPKVLVKFKRVQMSDAKRKENPAEDEFHKVTDKDNITFDQEGALCVEAWVPPIIFQQNVRYRLVFEIDAVRIVTQFTFYVESKHKRKRKLQKATMDAAFMSATTSHSDTYVFTTPLPKRPRLDSSGTFSTLVENADDISLLIPLSLLKAVDDYCPSSEQVGLPPSSLSVCLQKKLSELINNLPTTHTDSTAANNQHMLQLHYLCDRAAKQTQLPLLLFLLNSHKALGCLLRPNIWGHTAFSNVVYHGRNDAARMLLSKVETKEDRRRLLTMRSITGSNILHVVAANANTEMLELLFAYPSEYSLQDEDLIRMFQEKARVAKSVKASPIEVARHKLTKKAVGSEESRKYTVFCASLTKLVEFHKGNGA